jgi:hypothetical protein
LRTFGHCNGRHQWTFRSCDLEAEQACGRFARRRAGLGDDDGGGLDRGKAVGASTQVDSTREGAGGAQGLDESVRRFFGDDEDWTLKHDFGD